MGNQPNNFIQCGFNDKQVKEEVESTREEAILANRGQHIFKNRSQKDAESLVNSNQTLSTSKISSTLSRSEFNNQVSSSKISYANFIPEHENLTKVSKTPKNGYIKFAESALFEEDKGKCLDEIIENRYNTTMHFPEYQIKGLLESLIYGLAYMSKKNINHHDLYPTNIFYKDGNFKVLNPLVTKYSSYGITKQRKRFSFLSPELILDVLEDKDESEISKEVMDKSDVFAIGMILLEFCSLLPSSDCYDPESYSIIDSVIEERLGKISEVYNPLIRDCIDLMLQYEVGKRISPQELAYAFHSKVGEIKNNENSEQSRLNFNKMTMSGKVPGQQPLPLRAPGHNPEIIHSGFPHSNMNGTPHVLVANNLPQNSYILPPGSISPQIQNFKLSQSNQPNRLISSIPDQTEQGHPGFIPSSYSSSLLTKTTHTQSPNSKQKLNPFEQIEEEMKEDEDELVENISKIPPTNTPTVETRQKDNISFDVPPSLKPSTYIFKTTPSSNISASSYMMEKKNSREESLDERVNRILEASKHIK